MGSEYVKFVKGERVYGQKNLLQAQLGVLSSIKCFQDYKKLRNEEFLLKIELKNAIEEAFRNLGNLDRLLPVSSYKEDLEQEKQIVEGIVEEDKEKTLEEEIEMVRKKLMMLRA